MRSRASLIALRMARVAIAAACASACSASPGDGGGGAPFDSFDSREGESASAIVDGTQALAYPEAALVEMLNASGTIFAACSASIIAPKVVLTAGHCVDGVASWQVTAPYANGQTANATAGGTYDWHENGADVVNPGHHDIGLLFLDTPIALPSYPALAKHPLKDGTEVVNVGRILNGTIARHNLYAGAPVAVSGGASVGFPFDYTAKLIIESGDSGGPAELPGRTPHLIVAVSSGAGKSNEVLARVDLVYGWIQAQIGAHGGGGANPDATDGIGSARGNPAEGTGVPEPVPGGLTPIDDGYPSHETSAPDRGGAIDDTGGCAVTSSPLARGDRSRAPLAAMLVALASLFAIRRRGRAWARIG